MVALGGEGRGEGRRIGGRAATAPEQEYRGREDLGGRSSSGIRQEAAAPSLRF